MKNVGMLSLVIAVLIFTCTTHATIWYVHPDSTMNCVQDCLDSCSTGDTVLVGPGIYYENISWPSTQSILLMSEYGCDTTIIDGDSSGTVISVFGTADTTTIIRGLTIRGGYVAYGSGGGIYCYNSSPTIEDNIITHNVVDYDGGGIICDNASPIIMNNVISHNISLGQSWSGGGIQITQNSSPRVISNTITSNTAINGGGISCFMSSSTDIIIMNNTATDNSADEMGGGIVCWNASPAVTNNTLTGNTATWGGGIYIDYNASPIITDNTITNNTAQNSAGGVYIGLNSTSLLTRNVITGNSANSNWGGGIRCASSSSPTIKHCNISNNISSGITCNQASPDIDSCLISGNFVNGVYCTGNGGPVPDINWCDIYNNAQYGVLNLNPGDTVNAENNWWGHASGPYHPTANPGGLGDTVSIYVDFDPWLNNPGAEEQPIIKPVEKYHYIGATIFRGPLQLPEGKKCKVFDITGRVVEPDRIQPGIYFIEVDGVVTQKVVKVR